MNSPTLIEAARTALHESMVDDPTVVVLGEDVASGGAFGLTKGLAADFGVGRVRNTPISESSFTGVGIGLALGGRRALVEIMFNDFLTQASDQLVNHAAKIHYMSGGRQTVPLTVWTVGGAGTRWGAQHSQRLDGWLMQVPGLKMLAPSSPRLAAASLCAALADPNPVLILVDRSLLYSRAEVHSEIDSPWEPQLVQSGTDVTIVTSGRLVVLAAAAASELDTAADIIDLQCLAPLSVDRICESVDRTQRLVIAHDEPATGAVVPTVLAAVYERCHSRLIRPAVRVTSPATPVPAGPSLEDRYLVDQDDLAAGIRKALDR